MMLLKRLLLPGKGDAIICILILLNVLLWCGDLGENESVKTQSYSISKAFSSYSAIFAVTTTGVLSSKSSLSLSSTSCKYYGATLVTYYYLISLQFHRVYASEETLVSLSTGPTQQPVFNKTDPLSMTLALKKEEGGATIIASQQNNYNYNKRKRRRPVHNNSSLYSSSVISSNSSNFLSNNNDRELVNKISLSGRGDGSDLLFVGVGSGNSSSFSAHEDNMTDGSELKMSRKTNSTTHLKRRKKGRTRNMLQNHYVSNDHEDSTKKMKKRKPRLLKELTMFNRQNCLSKLLCGVQVAQPPTKSSSALNDYAYLVKAFFDRFSIRGIVTDVIDTAFAYEKDGLEIRDDGEADDDDDDDDDDSSAERRLKSSLVKIGNKYIGGAARHKAKRPHNYYYKYNPKYYEEYDKDLDDVALEELLDTDLPSFMEPEILRKRMGRKFVKPFNETECGNCTAGVNRNKGRVLPVDINLIRRKRGMMGEVKRGFMGFFNPRFDKTAYLDKRQLELESTDDTARQLNIAEEIAYRLRSPRQCRLLNWFGNNEKVNAKNTATSQQNGMTTTITTITNTGGMVGNLDRLNGMQTGLPQGMNTGAGGQGSQVVTVIQQSPVGASNGGSSSNMATTTVKPSSKATVMLNNMGQSASNAMAQAKDVATHLGSTICPFNIHELQELILKAQGAPFPHFLTTPPPSPTFPSQLFSQQQKQPPLPRSTLTTTTTTTTTTAEPTTTVKATKPPPKPASTSPPARKSSGQTRHGLGAGFGYGYDEFSDPEPTPPRYYHRPTDHYLYDTEVTPPSPPRYNYHSTTPRHRVINRRPNQTPRPQSPYHHHHTTPVYPTSAYHDDYYDRPDRQTNRPVLIPPVGLADVEEDSSEHESYGSYHSGKGASPYDRNKVHHIPNRHPKPVPKWMTTTTLSPDDLNFYGYNEPVPNYSYGTTQKSSGYKIQQNYKNPYTRQQKKGYKPGSQPNFDNPFTRDQSGNQPNFKNPFNREQPNGYKRRPVSQNSRNKESQYQNEEPEHVTYKIGPDLPRETTVAPTANYIREFHNPPVVVDSKKRFPPVGYRQRPGQGTQLQQPNGPVRGKPPTQNAGQNRPQQNKKSEEEDDDDSGSDSSDESDESSSGEARANMEANNPREPPRRPDPPTLPPPPPPGPPAGESMEDEDDDSNEAVEKKEVGAQDDDDESDEDNESNDENDGKRSYERSDFSKDRIGPPAAQSKTEKPMQNKVQSSSDDVTRPAGFFSGIFNSFGSMFNRNNKEKNPNSGGSVSTSLKQAPPVRNHLPSPPPTRKVTYPERVPDKSIDTASDQESDEEEDDDEDNESSEDEEENESEKRKKAKPKVRVTTTTAKPKRTAAPKKKSRDPPMPWVSSNTKPQVFLKTTPVPVVIEASSSWSVKRGQQDEIDDDYDEEYNYNPIDSLNDLTKQKKESENVKQTKKKENLYTGLGLSPGLSEFLNDLHQDLAPKKETKNTNKNKNTKKTVKKPASESVEDDDNDDDDDDASDESDEDDVSAPPKRRKMPPRPPFLPQEPID